MSDREEMAERIRAGLDPAPVCPYAGVHGPNARCPNCADWPRPDPERIAARLVDEHRERFPGVTAAWEGARTLGEALTTDAMYAARARFNARLAARPCCRAHGTTCPACRKADYEAPRWLARLRDLRDALRAWRHG